MVKNCDLGRENAAASGSIFKPPVTVFHHTDLYLKTFQNSSTDFYLKGNKSSLLSQKMQNILLTQPLCKALIVFISPFTTRQ